MPTVRLPMIVVETYSMGFKARPAVPSRWLDTMYEYGALVYKAVTRWGRGYKLVTLKLLMPRVIYERQLLPSVKYYVKVLSNTGGGVRETKHNYSNVRVKFKVVRNLRKVDEIKVRVYKKELKAELWLVEAEVPDAVAEHLRSALSLAS